MNSDLTFKKKRIQIRNTYAVHGGNRSAEFILSLNIFNFPTFNVKHLPHM